MSTDDQEIRSIGSNCVSVIVPTYNSEKVLGECLKSLSLQDVPPFEVIVSDGGSTDNTLAIARNFGAKVIEMAPNRSAQRNAGAERASGTYLLFIDSDMCLTTRVVSECLQKFDDSFAALVIPEVFVGTGYWGKVRGFERSFYDGVWYIEAARCYRRDQFLQLGGFDARLVGPEDWDLDERIRDFGFVGRIDSVIEHREGEVKLANLLKKKGHYAGSFPMFKELHPDRAALCFSLRRRCQIFFSRPTELLLHPVLSIGVGLVGAGEFGMSNQKFRLGAKVFDGRRLVGNPEKPWISDDHGIGEREKNRLTVLAFLNGFTEGMSGGDSWFMEVARRWERADLIVVTSELGKRACLERGLKCEFVITSSELYFRGVSAYLVRTWKAMRFVWSCQQIDVIHSTSDAPPDVLPAFLLRYRQNNAIWVQRICHLVAAKRGRKLASIVQRTMLSLVKRKCDQVLVISSMLKDELIKRGFRQEMLTVTLPGADASGLACAPQNVDTPGGMQSIDRYEAVFLGRLHASKGIFDLPVIWVKVLDRVPAARLAVIGHGDVEVADALFAAFERQGISGSVDLLGFLSRDILEETLRHARLMISPSHEEGYGLVNLEAAALSLPVVAWDLTIYMEHFRDFLVTVREGDVEAFANAISSLLLDDVLRETLAEKGSALAATLSWDGTASREWEVFETNLKR